MTLRFTRYFAYAHLPAHLQEISKPFCVLAHEMDNVLAAGEEKNFALRKLLEAKDCAVRAGLPPAPIVQVELSLGRGFDSLSS